MSGALSIHRETDRRRLLSLSLSPCLPSQGQTYRFWSRPTVPPFPGLNKWKKVESHPQHSMGLAWHNCIHGPQINHPERPFLGSPNRQSQSHGVSGNVILAGPCPRPTSLSSLIPSRWSTRVSRLQTHSHMRTRVLLRVAGCMSAWRNT